MLIPSLYLPNPFSSPIRRLLIAHALAEPHVPPYPPILIVTLIARNLSGRIAMHKNLKNPAYAKMGAPQRHISKQDYMAIKQNLNKNINNLCPGSIHALYIPMQDWCFREMRKKELQSERTSQKKTRINLEGICIHLFFVTLPVFWYFLVRGKQGRKERRRMAQKNLFKICSSVCKHRFAFPVPGPFHFGVQSDRNCCKTHMNPLKTWPTSLVLQMAARRTPPRLFANRAILWCGSCFDEFSYCCNDCDKYDSCNNDLTVINIKVTCSCGEPWVLLAILEPHEGWT